MSDHLTEQSVRAHALGHMSSAEIAALDAHLASCPACRHLKELTNAARRAHFLEAVSSDHFDAHLPYDRMAAACDAATLTAEESAHLGECASCKDLVEELSTLRDEIQVRTNPHRVLPFAPRPRHRGAWVSGAVAASILLFVSAFLLWSARQRNAPLDGGIRPVAAARHVTRTPKLAAPEQFRDGDGVVTIDGEGTVTGLPATSEVTMLTLRQLTKGTLRITSVAQLQGRLGVMLGASGQPVIAALLAPVGTVVRDQRPTFRWEAGRDADRVSIGVYDREFNRVAGSARVTGSTWKCSTPLRRGDVYGWQITIRHGERDIVIPSPPAPEARFQILSEQALAEIERVERSQPTSHLTTAAAYVDAGLLDEAERELRALADANPGSIAASRPFTSLRNARNPQFPFPITTKAAQ